MKQILDNIRILLTPGEKRKLLILTFVMAVGALMELAGISVLMPVVAVLTKPELLEQNRYLFWIYNLLGGGRPDEFLLTLCVAVILVFLSKNLFSFLVIKLQSTFIYSTCARWSGRLFNNYMQTDYEFHLQHSPPELMTNISLLNNVFNELMLALMMIVSEIIVIIAIIAILMFVMPGIVVIAGGTVAVISLIIYLVFSKYNFCLGQKLVIANKLTFKNLTQGLQGIKSVKIANQESAFTQSYITAESKLCQTIAQLYCVGQIPRLTFEFVVIALGMGLLVFFSLSKLPAGSMLLKISFLAIAMFRLLPGLSRIQYNMTKVRQCSCSFDNVYHDMTVLKAELPDNRPEELHFNHSVKFVDVTYSYAGMEKPVIKNFSAEFPHNSSTGIVGPTGSGKTTLVDLMCGLLKPESGKITIDDKPLNEHLAAWRRKIGYIPQTIYLTDDSISANVAFGVDKDKIDVEQIKRCLQLAQIYDFVMQLPQQLDTVIGDNGVRLSGGQRQRLGIARALYNQPDFLIFDEATSALDMETEQRLITALKTLKGHYTIVMIAHRLNTIEGCDYTIRLK